MSRSTLLRLLREHQRDEGSHGIDFRKNHVPMVLIALHRLGAGSKRMRAYYDGFADGPEQRIEQRRDPAIGEDGWTTRLGQPEFFLEYVALFRREIRARGPEAVLKTVLPRLLSGVVAHAFHPLIRLAYGIDFGDEEELVAALAYWASTYVRGPPIPDAVEPIDFGTLLERLSGLESLGALPRTGNIKDRVLRILAHPEFRGVLAPIKVDSARPLAPVAGVLRRAFEARHDFTLLHGVTSCHALRLVLPYLPDLQAAITQFCFAAAGAYLTAIHMASGATHRPLPEHLPSRRELAAGATRSVDEHTIKLTYTCLCESKAYEDDSYLRVAARDQETPAPFS